MPKLDQWTREQSALDRAVSDAKAKGEDEDEMQQPNSELLAGIVGLLG